MRARRNGDSRFPSRPNPAPKVRRLKPVDETVGNARPLRPAPAPSRPATGLARSGPSGARRGWAAGRPRKPPAGFLGPWRARSDPQDHVQRTGGLIEPRKARGATIDSLANWITAGAIVVAAGAALATAFFVWEATRNWRHALQNQRDDACVDAAPRSKSRRSAHDDAGARRVMTGWAAFPAGAGAESKVVPLKGRQ